MILYVVIQEEKRLDYSMLAHKLANQTFENETLKNFILHLIVQCFYTLNLMKLPLHFIQIPRYIKVCHYLELENEQA